MGPSDPGNPYAPPAADVNAVGPRAADGAALAGRGTRLGAAIIDGLLLFLALIPAFATGFAALRASALTGQQPSALWWLNGGIASIVSVLLWLAVEVLQAYLVTTSGQTIGKRLLGIRATKVDGSPVGFVDGVVLRRWLPMAVSWIPTVGGLLWTVNVLFIFRADRRCLHDLVARTRVIQVDER